MKYQVKYKNLILCYLKTKLQQFWVLDIFTKLNPTESKLKLLILTNLLNKNLHRALLTLTT